MSVPEMGMERGEVLTRGKGSVSEGGNCSAFKQRYEM